MNETWSQTESWWKNNRDNGYIVEVRHWTAPYTEFGAEVGRGLHRWNIYARIAPHHPRYEELKAEPNRLEMPGGVTKSEIEVKGGMEILLIGNDYNHSWNVHELWAPEPSGVKNVFADAEEIYRALSEGEIRDTPKSFVEAAAEGFGLEVEGE